MPKPLLEAFRGAVGSGEYERAHRLWNECAAVLDEEVGIRGLSEGDVAGVGELLEWSRTVVMCERAHLQEQLNRLQAELHVEAGYECQDSAAPPHMVATSF